MLARLHSKGARNIPFYYDVDIALPTDAICTAAFAQAFELAAISYSALRTAAMPILPRKRSELPAPMLPLNTHILLLPAVLVEGRPADRTYSSCFASRRYPLGGRQSPDTIADSHS